jgi:hypothetical protein
VGTIFYTPVLIVPLIAAEGAAGRSLSRWADFQSDCSSPAWSLLMSADRSTDSVVMSSWH